MDVVNGMFGEMWIDMSRVRSLLRVASAAAAAAAAADVDDDDVDIAEDSKEDVEGVVVVGVVVAPIVIDTDSDSGRLYCTQDPLSSGLTKDSCW